MVSPTYTRALCDMMRILHVVHQYRPAIGGAERHVVNLSEELVRRGHQVDVYTTRSTDHHTWRNVLPRFAVLDGVNVHRFDSIERGALTWKILRRGLQGYRSTRSSLVAPLIVWGNGPNSPALIWRLLRHGRGYDLIHTNSLHYAPVSYVFLVARLLGVPYALTPFVHIDQPGIFDIGFQNAIMRRADLVLAMTDPEKDYLTRRGVARDRVTVVGSGIHVEQIPRLDPVECRRRLDLPRSAFVLLFLARKEKYKGLEMLLAAFAQLQSKCPDLSLIAAGKETAHSRELRQRYAGLERLVFFDAVSDQLKQDLLNACDVFVLPSVGESFGIVYIEAWAVGKPVIGVKSGAIPGVIDDDVNGLLANPDSVSDMASKIMRIYEDSALRARLAAAGRRKAIARYTVGSVADAVEGAYLRTVRRVNNSRLQRRRA